MNSEEEVTPPLNTLAYKNDYTIDEETLKTSVKFASMSSMVVLALLNLFLATAIIFVVLRAYDLSLSLSNRILVSVAISIVIIIIGGLGGFTWQKIGLWVASNTYKIYTNKFDMPFLKYLGAIYLRFVGKDSVLYLEGQALDVNYTDVKYRLSFVLTLGISQLSFFLIYLTYMWNPIFNRVRFLRNLVPDYELEFQALLSIAFSIGTLAIYLPATFILRDANLRVWNTKSRRISQPLATIRSLIQSLIGISAIFTGWGVYSDITDGKDLIILGFLFPDSSFSIVYLLDYFAALVVIILITSPFVYPAAATYNIAHSRNVNKFRTGAILAGVEVGVSKVRVATREEKDNIGEYINLNIV